MALNFLFLTAFIYSIVPLLFCIQNAQYKDVPRKTIEIPKRLASLRLILFESSQCALRSFPAFNQINLNRSRDRVREAEKQGVAIKGWIQDFSSELSIPIT